MKVLLCHNYYRNRGGEDLSFEAEAQLLREHGHSVNLVTTDSSEIDKLSSTQTAWKTIWNRDAASRLKSAIAEFQPDITHFTNTFPLLSAAAVSAAHGIGSAVVASLRNYRLICPKANLWRNGSLCTLCATKTFAWPAVRYGCYRSSSVSAVLATANSIHRFAGASSGNVDLFYTLSSAARRHFVEGGFPAERIVTKPNFVEDPGVDQSRERSGAVFIGRLVPEKGVRELLAAWALLKQDVSLEIFGNGPLLPEVQAAANGDHRITAHGAVDSSVVSDALREAEFAIVPSLWPEPFGRVVIEAFAVGTPVIGSNRGAIPELLAFDENAAIFDPSFPEQLADLASQLIEDSPRLAAMRVACRAEYERNYTPAAQYPKLMKVYQHATENCRRRGGEIYHSAKPDQENLSEEAHEPTC